MFGSLHWMVAGALIGLIVPALLMLGGRQFGVSANLRHLCALAGARPPLFRYDWRREGAWNLVFALGLVAGGAIGTGWLAAPFEPARVIATATLADLRALGISDPTGIAPPQLLGWTALSTWPGIVTMVGGGFLLGFGARWAGGCTSGHAISGLSAFDGSSLLAVLGFFAGGLFITHLVLRWLL